jgi:hypothetical protein
MSREPTYRGAAIVALAVIAMGFVLAIACFAPVILGVVK